MKHWNIETIRDLLLESGRIALSHFSAPQTKLKRDSSLVTVADRAVESFLEKSLTGDGDGARMIGEESVDSTTEEEVVSALEGTTWVVDPIDGTAPYANRLPTWAVSIGLMEGGTFSQGAWFLPRIGEMYITNGNEVLFSEESRDPERWQFTNLQPLAPIDVPFTTTGMISLPHDIARTKRFTGDNPVQAIGSAVYSMAQMVQGRYIGCITSLKLWDIAGAVPILRRMGYQIQFPGGRELADTVSSTDWITDARSRQLWKARGALYISQSDETLSFMHHHYRDDNA